MPALNGWIGRLFAREHLDETVQALVASRGAPARTSGRDQARLRLSDAETKLQRYQAAIAAGVEPAALASAINQAHTERTLAEAELSQLPEPNTVDAAEVYAMADSLGLVGEALKDAKPDRLARLYADLNLGLRFEPGEKAVHVTVAPRVVNERVRGGT